MRDITRATTTKRPITSSAIDRVTELDATVTASVVTAHALLAGITHVTSGDIREIIGDLRTRVVPRQCVPRVVWTVATPSNTTARVTCW